jgi:hypothetical protein
VTSHFNLHPENITAVLSAPSRRLLRAKINRYLAEHPDAQVVRQWRQGRWYRASLTRPNEEQVHDTQP